MITDVRICAWTDYRISDTVASPSNTINNRFISDESVTELAVYDVFSFNPFTAVMLLKNDH